MRTHIRRILQYTNTLLKTDTKKLLSSSFWLSITRVLGTGSGILLTITFANTLTPESFGVYKYVLAGAGLLSAFSLSGLNTAVTRAVAQGNDLVVRPLFRFGIITSLPASAVGLCIAAYYLFAGNHLLGVGFLFVALTNPLFNNLGISKAIILGKEDHRTYAFYNSLGAIIPVLIIGGVVFLTKDVFFVIMSYFVVNVLSGLIIYYATLRKYTIPHTNQMPAETARYGSHMSVIGFFSQISGQIDQILMWHFIGPVALATYALALAPIRELRVVAENVFVVAFPRFARTEKHLVKNVLPLRFFQMLFVCGVIYIAYLVASPLLYKTLFPAYESAIPLSNLLALGLLFVPKGIIDTYLIAHGAVKIRYIVTIGALVTKSVLFIALIPAYGMTGAVIAILAADAFHTLLLISLYRRF